MRSFTLEELARYDGRDGARSYIAYDGKVYDVTDSFLWQRGEHWALHRPGRDLTASLADAPHGEDLLQRVPVIGVLVEE